MWSKFAVGQKQGLAAIDSMKQHLVKAQPDTHKVRIMYRIADRYIAIAPDSAKYYATEALALAKKLQWTKGIGALMDCLGSIHSNNGNYPVALKYYRAAYEFNKKIDHRVNMAKNLNNIGSVYQRQANSVKAQEYNFKALKLAEDENIDDLMGLLYGNIANIYLDQGDLEKSLTYYYKSLKKHEEMDDQAGIADAYNSLAIVHYHQNNLKSAETYYNKSLKIYKSMDDKMHEAILLSQMAMLYEQNKDNKISYMLRAQKLFDETNPKHGNSITNMGNIGGTYADIYVNKLLGKGPYKNIPADYNTVGVKAEEYLNKAIKYSKEVGDNDNLSYFLDNLAQLQEAQGNYQQALENFKASKGIDD
jgi:tetratricopeptide (TPR) repeat protein